MLGLFIEIAISSVVWPACWQTAREASRLFNAVGDNDSFASGTCLMPAILSFKMHGVMPVIRHTRPPELTGMTHFHASMQNKSKMKLVSEAGAKYNVQGDSWRWASFY